MGSITNTTAPGDAWHSPLASRCKASTRLHLAVTFKAAFWTTTPANRAPLSREKPVSLLGDVTSLVEEGSSGAGLAQAAFGQALLGRAETAHAARVPSPSPRPPPVAPDPPRGDAASAGQADGAVVARATSSGL